jgi:hypothetical protein
MNISSLTGQHVANSAEELRSILADRHDGRFGTFWISAEMFPVLVVGINDGLAWLNYIPGDEEAGFLSQGDRPKGEPDVEFLDDDGQPDFRPASCVILTSLAEHAVDEFFATKKLPTCVRWLEL